MLYFRSISEAENVFKALSTPMRLKIMDGLEDYTLHNPMQTRGCLPENAPETKRPVGHPENGTMKISDIKVQDLHIDYNSYITFRFEVPKDTTNCGGCTRGCLPENAPETKRPVGHPENR